MAEIVGQGAVNDAGYWLHKWEGLAAGDSGNPVQPEVMADKEVQVTGTLTVTTVTWQGSMDGGTTWYTLEDAQGGALSFSAAGGKTVLNVPQLVRPLLAGGASSGIDCYIGGPKRI